MNNYPSLEHSTGRHYVRYTLQSGPYKGSFVTVTGGNCTGASVIDTEIFDIMDELDLAGMEYDHLKLRYNYDCNGIDVDFLDDEGDVVCSVGADTFDSCELQRLIVAIEIIDYISCSDFDYQY